MYHRELVLCTCSPVTALDENSSGLDMLAAVDQNKRKRVERASLTAPPRLMPRTLVHRLKQSYIAKNTLLAHPILSKSCQLTSAIRNAGTATVNASVLGNADLKCGALNLHPRDSQQP